VPERSATARLSLSPAGRAAIAELVIKDERGRIVGKDSHGNDPRHIKG
jgi:hypothetical protein